LPSFPYDKIPSGWYLDKSFDWGSTKPFSIGWWAESNGEPLEWNGRKFGGVPGDVIRLAEWYGWTGHRNEGVRMLAPEIAEGVLDREEEMGLKGKFHSGPADTNIFDTAMGKSIANDMKEKGVVWREADKGPGSRKQGWEQMRKMFKQAIPIAGNPRELPGLFVTDRCEQFIETVPFLPRDDLDLDDVDTESEDHIADETRYRLRYSKRIMKQESF
jgi:hypothetical protein